jgi:hypothetical protein
METPLELAIKVPAPEVSPAEVEHVCDFLRGQGWVKARNIEAVLKIDERKIRAIAEHSQGRILSGPGCPGYKLFDGRAEIGEADLAATRLESQARHMLSRAIAYRKRMHRLAK